MLRDIFCTLAVFFLFNISFRTQRGYFIGYIYIFLQDFIHIFIVYLFSNIIHRLNSLYLP